MRGKNMSQNSENSNNNVNTKMNSINKSKLIKNDNSDKKEDRLLTLSNASKIVNKNSSNRNSSKSNSDVSSTGIRAKEIGLVKIKCEPDTENYNQEMEDHSGGAEAGLNMLTEEEVALPEYSDDTNNRPLTEEEAEAQQKLREFQKMGYIDVEIGEVSIWRIHF